MIIAIGTYISGAELTHVSALDFANYQDTEVNWRVVEGLGTTIAAAGDDLDVTLDCPVLRIDHSGKRLKIETAKGAISADQAIVTLPSTVLGENEDLFAPALPEKTQAARGLPLGLADKLFLSLSNAEEFEPGSRLFGAKDRTATATYHIRPFGRPLIEAYFGGSHAAALEAGGACRLLRLRSVRADRPARQRFRAPDQAGPSFIFGAPIRSRAAPIHMPCPAKWIVAPSWPSRSTGDCFSPVRPARTAIFRPRMAAISRARPPPTR